MKKLILGLLLSASTAFAGIYDNGNRAWTLLNTTDSVNAVQSGTWNLGTITSLGNITGTISLPTGAATSANQTSEITQLTAIATNTASALNDTLASGSITTACATEAGCASTSFVQVDSQGAYTISASIAGTFVGTYVVDNQLEDGTWVPAPFYIVTGSLPYASAFSGTTVQQFYITGGGVLATRVRCSAFTSGSIAVGLDASLAQQTTFSAQLGTWSVKAQLQDNAGTAITVGQKVSASSVPVVVASDQSTIPTTTVDVSSTGSLAALNAVVTVSAKAANTVNFQILGTYVGTISFLYSMDGGTTYNAISGTFLNGSFSQVNQTSGTGEFSFNTGGFTNVQAKMTAYTSGTATITAVTSAANLNAGTQRLQDSSGNNIIVGNTTMSASLPVTMASNQTAFPINAFGIYNSTLPTGSSAATSQIQNDIRGRQIISPNSGINTYSATFVGAVTATTATDVFTIFGGAKKATITKIGFSATQTTAATETFLVTKKTAVNATGTSAAVTAMPMDSTEAAATATLLSYTANPGTLGAATNIRALKVYVGTTTTALSPVNTELKFNEYPDKGVTLNSTSEGLAFNLNSQTIAGNAFTIYIEWNEE